MDGSVYSSLVVIDLLDVGFIPLSWSPPLHNVWSRIPISANVSKTQTFFGLQECLLNGRISSALCRVIRIGSVGSWKNVQEKEGSGKKLCVGGLWERLRERKRREKAPKKKKAAVGRYVCVYVYGGRGGAIVPRQPARKVPEVTEKFSSGRFRCRLGPCSGSTYLPGEIVFTCEIDWKKPADSPPQDKNPHKRQRFVWNIIKVKKIRNRIRKISIELTNAGVKLEALSNDESMIILGFGSQLQGPVMGFSRI
jgi:hypothetical protein